MPYPLPKEWMVLPYDVFEKIMGHKVDTTP
jgi:hypothetical protein